jgi:Transposase
MLAPEIRCVVGIDVAKHFHVVCALDAPSGSLRQRAAKIAATAEGYAPLCRWLRTWGEPAALLIGMEATGTLWEPLHDTLTRAGYTVLVLNPRQTSAWAASLGLRARDRWHGCPDPGAWPVGGLCPGEHLALGNGPSLAGLDADASRSHRESVGSPTTGPR